MAEIQYYATGRRKSSTARVTITPGDGQIIINDKPVNIYFPRETLRMMLRQPVELAGITGKYNITATVTGGGLSGQAGAIRHGIARAIVNMDSDLRSRLKKEGFLRRDPREKERKKYGQKGARKRFQFSKR
ncbi:MAG: 30S ribosomal protein S9 [Nitrospirota bacterium]|jgi:small subunit ribosomal protein S9|nr:30S ribosomal protein S9 [Thermodesulfovibrionales bacterium]